MELYSITRDKKPSPAKEKNSGRPLSKLELGKLAFFLLISFGSALIFILTPSLLPSALLSILLFFVFAPIIDAVERKGIHRTYAILVVFTVCGLTVGIGTSFLVPRVSQEIAAFQKDKMQSAGVVKEKLKQRESAMVGHIGVFKDSNFTEKAFLWFEKSAGKIWSIVPDLASHLMVCLFLVPFLTFVLLKDSLEIRRQLLRLVPNRYFETVYSLSSRVLEEMGGYVSARILEAALVSLIVGVGCLAGNIPYAILLGFFAGATNPIPYLGPLLGAAPGIFFALLDPQVDNQLVLVGLIFLVANLVDMLVIFPVVVAKIVDLHPVVVIVSVMLGSQFFGVLGMILAVPVTSILKICFQEIYSRLYKASTL